MHIVDYKQIVTNNRIFLCLNSVELRNRLNNISVVDNTINRLLNMFQVSLFERTMSKYL